ncbi:hypothetical protein F5887DRAFT_237318 [Amanita rubescens]|nr:hypothetical protein F5887DRAFT_237318 [Amanita rubescens]
MIVQKLVIEAEEKTKILKPRGFSEAETNSRNVLLDVGGLLSNIPLARSVTDLVLRFWRGSDPTNMDITSSPDAQNPLFRRLIPGPGPWPGGNGPLDNVDSSAGPVQNACIITYMIFDLSVGARDAFKLLGISFDQNTRISFWRKVNTLYYHCVGSNQPKGGFTINTIQSSLKNISSLWTRRSGEGNLIHPSFLGHKCDGVTMGSAMSNGLNPYSSVFAFSSTVPIGRKPN